MGSCIDPPKVTDPAEQIRLLSGLRNNVLTTIETNKVKISRAEKEIQEIDDNMKQIENDLRQNQYSYSETEKLQKAQKVLELKVDRQRAQKSLDLLKANNTNLKNNLSMIESKIEEVRNNQTIQGQVNIMGQIDNADPTAALQKNLQDIMRQQQKDEEMLRVLNSGNNAVSAGMGTADDVLKQILGSGTGGAPPAY
jgi:predicted RNA-binding protein with EMAP domain